MRDARAMQPLTASPNGGAVRERDGDGALPDGNYHRGLEKPHTGADST